MCGMMRTDLTMCVRKEKRVWSSWKGWFPPERGKKLVYRQL